MNAICLWPVFAAPMCTWLPYYMITICIITTTILRSPPGKTPPPRTLNESSRYCNNEFQRIFFFTTQEAGLDCAAALSMESPLTSVWIGTLALTRTKLSCLSTCMNRTCTIVRTSRSGTAYISTTICEKLRSYAPYIPSAKSHNWAREGVITAAHANHIGSPKCEVSFCLKAFFFSVKEVA